jgi:hypothetical protein
MTRTSAQLLSNVGAGIVSQAMAVCLTARHIFVLGGQLLSKKGLGLSSAVNDLSLGIKHLPRH